MKILKANKFYYLKGGAERHYFDLIGLLNNKGHEIIPFSMLDARNHPTKYNNYFVSKIGIAKPGFSLEDLKSAGRILYSFEAKKKLAKLLQKEKIDIAHIHNIYHQISPSILTVLKNNNIPVVMTVHDFKLMCPVYTFYTHGEVCERCKVQKYYNCVLHKCAKDSYAASAVNMLEMHLHRFLNIYRDNVDMYICPSDFLRRKMIDFGWPRKKITVLKHFIAQENNAQPDSKDYALYFGRLIKEKGVKDLLKAYQYLKYNKLKIVGTGPQEKEYRNFVKENNLKNIEFTGYLAGEELKKAIAGARYVVVPSVSYETFGLTVTESFAMGKPVIASDIGALPELVVNGKTGLIFEPGNWRDLKNKIIEMEEDESKISEMGANALQFTQKQLNPESYYQKLIEVYQNLKNK